MRRGPEPRLAVLEEALEHARDLDGRLEPLGRLSASDPFIYVSVGGGELGDMVLTAARRSLGGRQGGVLTAAIDRYQGFPAQDSADVHAVIDMMDGDALERAISGMVGDPRRRHAIFLEVEAADVGRVFEMSRRGYNVVSTPYAPLVGMDRLATKLLISKLGVPAVEWRYAGSEEELREAAEDLGFPVIVKPVMTSSGHGTSVVWDEGDLGRAYEHSIAHARGRGDEVIVERYLPELRTRGLELTQLVLRAFDEDGRLRTIALPAVGHTRPGAVYVESWMPSGVPRELEEEGAEQARRIADALGGLGLYAVEQFVIDGRVYTSEFANRPHDTGMVTRWALSEDEGSLHLRSTMGLLVEPPRLLDPEGYCAARVVLAPEDVVPGSPVLSWNPSAARASLARDGVRGDAWFFGKPAAYPGRRMGLVAACSGSLEVARSAAARAAGAFEEGIAYGPPAGEGRGQAQGGPGRPRGPHGQGGPLGDGVPCALREGWKGIQAGGRGPGAQGGGGAGAGDVFGPPREPREGRVRGGGP